MRSPIGIFDSGLGGLSVAARVLNTLPNERIIYFADNAHVPYGEKPMDIIRGYALEITQFLINKGAKAVVMACNMSSASALETAQKRFPEVPIIGMIEPGARAALSVANGKPIGVLATTGTINNGAYARTINHLDAACKVVGQACPKFVPLVESGQAESEEAKAAARMYVAPLASEYCSTIILGCTHYPFLKRAIEAAAGSSIAIVDPADEVTRTLAAILAKLGKTSDALASPHEFYTSGDTAGFASIGSAFLGRNIDAVQHAEWGIDLGELSAVSSQHSAGGCCAQKS
ncbi:MAG: glutamate racemase [Armatimonadetes bacterium]|nr:glutamate racemase [Armatimonadota bacterium]